MIDNPKLSALLNIINKQSRETSACLTLFLWKIGKLCFTFSIRNEILLSMLLIIFLCETVVFWLELPTCTASKLSKFNLGELCIHQFSLTQPFWASKAAAFTISSLFRVWVITTFPSYVSPSNCLISISVLNMP